MFENLQSYFGLKKIVFVNSASHAYSELPLDGHLAMFGKNNVGKTASLSATKLLLYPENNFYKCEQKFNFTSKKGECFSKQDSYVYYFPTPTSFLILEAENIAGTFCMILYRTQDFHYERAMLAVPYDEIRELFWDNSEKNFAKDLSVDRIKQAVKTYKGLLFSEPKQIREVLFANFASATSQFCLVPLKDNSDGSIQAFKRIFELAFNAGKDEESTLPQAIATIIEMKRDRKEERLESNFDEIQQAYHQLSQKSLRLKNLRNNQPVFEQLKQSFDGMSIDFKSYQLKSAVLTDILHQQQEQDAEQHQQISEQLQHLISVQYPLQQQLDHLERYKTEKHGQLQLLHQQIVENNEKIQTIEQLANHYDGQIDTAIYRLEQRFEHIQSYLQGFKDKSKWQHQLNETVQEQQRLQKRKGSLQQTLSAQRYLVLNQVSHQSASILQSLGDFTQWHGVITIDEQHIIETFAALFEQDGQQLYFKQQAMDRSYQNYDSQAVEAKLQAQLHDTQQELQVKEYKISELQRLIQNVDSQVSEQNQRKLEREFQQLNDDIRLLKANDEVRKQLSEKQKQYQEFEQELQQLKQQWQQINRQTRQLDQDITLKKQQLKEIQEHQREYASKQKWLERAKTVLHCDYVVSKQADYQQCYQEYVQQSSVSLQDYEQLAEMANDLHNERNNFDHKLQYFMEQQPLDELDAHKERNSWQDLSEVIQKYHGIFSTLKSQQQLLTQQIKTHNETLASMIKEVQNAHQLLKSNIEKINHTLSQYKISNFEYVRLKLTTTADFDHLWQNCQKYDAYQDSLMEQSFYDELIGYVKKHSKHRQLKLVNLIKSIHYEYVYANHQVETKPQSGGTTSTVTSFILSILLKDILRADCQFKMPVIVDEIGTIDRENVKTITEQISSAGFSMFCATPTSSTPICQAVGYYVHIDLCQFRKPLYAERCILNILPEFINHFGLKHEN